jgi:hypothetical protein
MQKNKEKIELHHLHEKQSQYFIVVKADAIDQGYVIQDYSDPTNLLCFDKILSCKNIDKSNSCAIWRPVKIIDNVLLNRSCIISCLYSGLVM